ncbi:MAG: alpha/beta hydrolase [Candidatus Wildermuthbacteria bacterium]|nr:alpha/beta hydrolase [Candidatus Wildermuthbacteria bacterium]
MKQVLICHAYKALPSENWYTWLAQALCARGYEAQVLELPSPLAPSEKEWVECIGRSCTDDPVIFVGHSLGCRAILACIDQHNVRAERVVLVGCPMFWEGIIETRPPLKAYVEGMQKLDFRNIKNLVGQFDIFHDTTDHILPMKNVEYLKEMLGDKASVHISNGYGHFDVAEVPESLLLFPEIKKGD